MRVVEVGQGGLTFQVALDMPGLSNPSPNMPSPLSPWTRFRPRSSHGIVYNTDAPNTICRQLGYDVATEFFQDFSIPDGGPEQPIWLHWLFCPFGSVDLSACSYSPIEESPWTCTHIDDVKMQCTRGEGLDSKPALGDCIASQVASGGVHVKNPSVSRQQVTCRCMEVTISKPGVLLAHNWCIAAAQF